MLNTNNTRAAKNSEQLRVTADHGPRKSNSVKNGSVDWFSTLTKLAINDGNSPQPIFYQCHAPEKALNLVVLDTSGSSMKSQGVNDALGVTEWLYRQSYLQRHQFALIGFGNDQVQWIIKPQQASKSFEHHLPDFKAGGGTPLTDALQIVSQFHQRSKRQEKTLNLRVFIMTDGMSRDPLPKIEWDCPVHIIDIERSAVRVGKAQQLAVHLNADYCHIDQLETKN